MINHQCREDLCCVSPDLFFENLHQVTIELVVKSASTFASFARKPFLANTSSITFEADNTILILILNSFLFFVGVNELAANFLFFSFLANLAAFAFSVDQRGLSAVNILNLSLDLGSHVLHRD